LAPEIIGDEVVETLTDPDLVNELFGSTSIAIQTNGRSLMNYLDKLRSIRQWLVLKVSLHTFNAKSRRGRVGSEEQVKETIRTARADGFRIGVNVVLTKDTADYVEDVAEWCRSIGVYLKILDLNWYPDIGRRVHGFSGDLYWKEQYLSSLRFYYNKLRSKYGQLHPVALPFGIPMFQTDQEDNGFFIRVKDSACGSHYAPECRACPFFVQRRRCQEGVYQPWITPALGIKVCRHRPDIHEDLSEVLRTEDAEQAIERVVEGMRKMLQRYYWPSYFVPLRKPGGAV
jgi:MoaA/NifB/PqqE/SkfB family radical SAM enzyme